MMSKLPYIPGPVPGASLGRCPVAKLMKVSLRVRARRGGARGGSGWGCSVGQRTGKLGGMWGRGHIAWVGGGDCGITLLYHARVIRREGPTGLVDPCRERGMHQLLDPSAVFGGDLGWHPIGYGARGVHIQKGTKA